jgi:hypothetical protein
VLPPVSDGQTRSHSSIGNQIPQLPPLPLQFLRRIIRWLLSGSRNRARMAQKPPSWLIGMGGKSRYGNQRLPTGETLLRTRLSRRIELVGCPPNSIMDILHSAVRVHSWLLPVPCLQAGEEQNRTPLLLHSWQGIQTRQMQRPTL